MNVVDHIIGYFNPEAGLKRANCRKALRMYDAAKH